MDIALNTINTCFASTSALHTIAYYSHLIPIAASVILSIFIYKNSNFKLASRLFALFVLSFSFWLIADLVTWVSQDYYTIHFFWSLLDYVNLLFVLLSFYLFWTIVTGKDLPFMAKITLFAIQLPAFISTVTENSVVGFDQVWCESTEGDFIVKYKAVVSLLVICAVIGVLIWRWFKNKSDRKKLFVISTGLLLFLSIFSVTEYISVITGHYEINLYGSFSLPIFIGMLVYSIVKYNSFDVKLIASNALVFSLVVIIGAQFFFIRNPINLALNTVGFIFVLISGYLLVKSVQRNETQKQNLEKANKQQESLMRFINHQVKGFLTRSRLIFDALKNNEYGDLTPEARKLVDVGFDTNTQAVQMVKSLLDASNLQDGTVNYQHVNFDFRALVSDIVGQLKPTAEAKNLKINTEIDSSKEMMVNGDLTHLAQAVRNLIENAIQYTSAGAITVSMQREEKIILFKVADTGLGLTEEDKKVLFQQGGRGQEAQKRNVNSTGYGLFITYKIIKDHNGHIKAFSAGRDKGSVFEVRLPLV
jgi:signal transduction histidine kinase